MTQDDGTNSSTSVSITPNLRNHLTTNGGSPLPTLFSDSYFVACALAFPFESQGKHKMPKEPGIVEARSIEQQKH